MTFKKITRGIFKTLKLHLGLNVLAMLENIKTTLNLASLQAECTYVCMPSSSISLARRFLSAM